MKRHNALKVVLCTLAVFLLLTWILPTAYFQTSYVTQGRIQMGLFDIVNYPMTALQYFGYGKKAYFRRGIHRNILYGGNKPDYRPAGRNTAG